MMAKKEFGPYDGDLSPIDRKALSSAGGSERADNTSNLIEEVLPEPKIIVIPAPVSKKPARRLEVINVLGEGSQGIVALCRMKENDQPEFFIDVIEKEETKNEPSFPKNWSDLMAVKLFHPE